MFLYSLVLPLVTRELVSLLQSGVSSSNETSDLSDFGFLYGTFPTAPGVFVYSTQFNVDPDLVIAVGVGGRIHRLSVFLLCR